MPQLDAEAAHAVDRYLVETLVGRDVDLDAAVGAQRALVERPELADSSAEQVGVSSWINGAEFQKVTSSDGANAIARLNGRINFVKNKLVKHGDD